MMVIPPYDDKLRLTGLFTGHYDTVVDALSLARDPFEVFALIVSYAELYKNGDGAIEYQVGAVRRHVNPDGLCDEHGIMWARLLLLMSIAGMHYHLWFEQGDITFERYGGFKCKGYEAVKAFIAAIAGSEADDIERQREFAQARLRELDNERTILTAQLNQLRGA